MDTSMFRLGFFTVLFGVSLAVLPAEAFGRTSRRTLRSGPRADVSVQLQVTNTGAVKNTLNTIYAVVENLGPETAPELRFTMQLYPNFTAVSVADSRCSVNGNFASCTFQNVVANTSVSVPVVFTPTEAATCNSVETITARAHSRTYVEIARENNIDNVFMPIYCN